MLVYELEGYRYEVDLENSQYRLISNGDAVQFVNWHPYRSFIVKPDGFVLTKSDGVMLNVRTKVPV